MAPSARRRLTTGQRVVLSIGLAIALYAIVHTNVLGLGEGDGDWFNYSPNSAVLLAPDSVRSVMRGQRNWTTLQWLVGAAIWTVVSFWLFRGTTGGPSNATETGSSSDDAP